MKPIRILGKLCPRKHEYKNTGKTLRNDNYQCMACCREIGIKYYYANRTEKLEKQKIYRTTEKGARLTSISTRKSKIKNAAIIRKRYLTATKNLTDVAVKQMLHILYGLPVSQMSKKLIEMKREQLLFTRKLRGIKRWVLSTHNLPNLQL